MFLAYLVPGKIGASFAASYAYFHPELSIWWALALYVIVGNVVFLGSAAVVLLLAARREADDADLSLVEPQLPRPYSAGA